MRYDGNRLLPFEWISAIAWTFFWGVLGYLAIAEKSISLGGRSISHFEGQSAVVLGCLLFGVSLLGVASLLRFFAFKRLLWLLLFLGWFSSTIIYLVFIEA